MAKANLFGWDLTLLSVQKDISEKKDVLIAFIHWNLVKNDFFCLGIGDEKTLKSGEVGSELLPSGWNRGPTLALRYRWMDEVYIFHALVTDGNIIFNLLRGSDLNVSNLAINIDSSVGELSGPLSAVIPGYFDIMHRVKTELIEPVTNRASKGAETQTEHTPSSEGLFRKEERFQSPQSSRPIRDGQSIGRSDLDPFHGGGSGMIFDPFQRDRNIQNPGLGVPGGLPRGSVPPGARFDPFSPLGQPYGPPGPRRPPPDSDHLPPPGWDDMFM